MLKDIKLGFKLLRYGYKLKLNVIMFVFFAVIGIASDIMSKGTSIIGGVYFMMCGMFTFQLIMSMDVSELIQSTSLKKKLQIYIPVMSSTVINLVVFTFLQASAVFITDTIPNRPIREATRLMPLNRFTLPKVRRGVPFCGSIPMTAIRRPIMPERSPFGMLSPLMLVMQAIPNREIAKYSPGPNFNAKSASTGVKNISTRALNSPPKTLAMVEVPRARPAFPCFASG